MTTSTLWKTLGATQALFEVSSPSLPGDGIVRDEQITGIKIDAGTTMAGLSTSAAEVTLAGYHPLDYTSDKPILVELSAYGRTLLAGLLGVDAQLIADRFRGRIAGQKVTDNGDTRTDITTITAQDWAAFVSQIDRGGYASQSTPGVDRMYRSMFNHSGIPGYTSLDQWGSTWHWIKWPDGQESESQLLISTSDIIGKYCADLGNLISVPRNGVPRAWSHDHLQALAQQWWTSNLHPLQRSQVLKPVEWSRNVSIPIKPVWKEWAGVGAETYKLWTFPPPADMVHREEEYDYLHVWVINGSATETGLTDVMAARTYRAASAYLHVQKVTIDLLALVRRNQGTDRAMAAQVLAMNHGDPLALGWDWPGVVNGVYFAERVSHNITRDSWTVDLDLVPTYYVTGQPSTSDIYGQTWQTATPPSTEWHLIAEQTTWEWSS